jgi:membrane protein involved in colicin uptake
MQPENMNVVVARPDEAALVTGAEKSLAIAQSIEIDSADMYRLAGDELATIKGKAKQLDEQRKSITKPLDDAKKAVMDLFLRPLEILTSAENSLKRSMLTYDQEQRRKQEEEQRKASEAAAAERRRQQEEAAQKAEEARKAAEAGDTQKAAELQQQAEEKAAVAEMITAPVIQMEKPKAAGVNVRKTYKARVTDMKALLQAVIDGKVPEAVIEVNESVLNSQARSLKESMKYPGVEVYTEEGISARSA